MNNPKTFAVSIPVNWEQEQPVPGVTNVAHIQRLPTEEIVITFGHVSPLIYGANEKQKEQAESLSKAGIIPQTVARVSLTVPAARELLNMLSDLLKGEKP